MKAQLVAAGPGRPGGLPGPAAGTGPGGGSPGAGGPGAERPGGGTPGGAGPGGPSPAWQAYRLADPATREAMVARYLPLVKHIAGRLAVGLPGHVELDELFSHGVFGLLDAMERFDPERGVKFETYAYTRIRGAIVDGLRAADWVPASLRQKARQVEDAYRALEGRLGRSAEDEEVAGELGMSTADFRRLLSELERTAVLSLDEVWTADSEDGEFRLRDLVGDETATDPLESAEMRDRRDILARAIERLPEKERLVVSMFYYDGLAPKEIAAVLRLSVSRISQLHSKAMLRLRGQLADMRGALG
jgi:RNA polymerase sigma factor for flagellar operon FliA